MDELKDLLWKKDCNEEELGFVTKLRKEKIFDKQKLEHINEKLINYREVHKKEILIDTIFMNYFYCFICSCKMELGCYSLRKKPEIKAVESEALDETHSILVSIVEGYPSSDLAKRLVELLLKNKSGDEDGYLVKIKEGRDINKNQMDEILDVMDEYYVVYKDCKYVEKTFMYAFLDFLTTTFDNAWLYKGKPLGEIYSFCDQVQYRIARLTKELWIVK